VSTPGSESKKAEWTFPDGQVPAYFIAGPSCGAFASVWEVERIMFPSPRVANRMHVYERTGRVLPTEPPARVYEHLKIIDGIA